MDVNETVRTLKAEALFVVDGKSRQKHQDQIKSIIDTLTKVKIVLDISTRLGLLFRHC
jgi:hypothetical protein